MPKPAAVHGTLLGGAKTQGALVDLFLAPLAAAAACPGSFNAIAKPIVFE